MTEGTEGTAFFSVKNDFATTARDAESLAQRVTAALASIRNSFSGFGTVDVDPLGKIAAKVDQQAGLIERRLADLSRKYENLAKAGQTPAVPFSAAAGDIVTKGAGQVDKAIIGQAGSLGDADLSLLRRTVITAFTDGGTAAARALQSQLRSVLKESGSELSAGDVAGSANSLRSSVVARPLLQGVPEEQSAADYVAATKGATKARQNAAQAAQVAADADQQAAKASNAAAASGGKGGGTPPPPPPPPPPPEPPSGRPPLPDGPRTGGLEELSGAADAEQKKAIAELRQRIQDGVARFINGSSAIYDPLGPGAAKGNDIVSPSAEPIHPIIADRLRQQIEAEIAQLEAQITSGSLIKLGGRFATQPLGSVSDADRTFLSRSTAQPVDNEKDLAAAQSLLAEETRKSAAAEAASQVAENERRLAQELLLLAEDVAAKRKAGVLGPETGVRQVGQNIIDERGGSPVVFNRTTSGGVNQLIPELQPLRFSAVLLKDQQQIAAAETANLIKAEREQAKAAADQAAATREAERAQRAATRTANRTGVGNNFISGLTSGGFSGEGNGGIDGLAHAAGTTLKYSALYQTLGLVQQALHSAVAGFLDANDSITEYQVATGNADAVSAGFQTTLESIAQVGGFNVGEAMDVASKGVRAFGDEIDQSTDKGQAALDRLGVGFARQAAQLATLSKTTLTDAAGNLTSVAAGFDLPKNNAGFSRVTDAIAGAKLAGGGDETQIFQGLANSAIVFKQLGFNLNESATILSKINSQTDESGTLIANRLSRLSSILSGSAATKFIQSLNQQLPAAQQIDRTKAPRDQLIALSKAYQNLDESRRGALINLGGTAQDREFTVLLQQLPQIVEEANRIKPGAGLKEFETRLTNVRAVLTQIQGFIQTIIVNLTTSGLADPIIELVAVLRTGLQILSGVSQGFKELADLLSVNIGGANVGIVSLIAHVGALGIALKAITAIRAAGGIRGAITAAEEHIAPGRALARQQLAGIDGASTTSTASPGTLLAGVQGRALAASESATAAVRLPRNVAADKDVAAAADDVKAGALRLAAAEDAQAALINHQTEERRAFAANNPGDSAGLRALNEKQATERTQAAQAGITSQLDLTTAQAQLARALRVQAAQAEVAAEFDARRTAITGQFQRQIGGTIGQFQAAEAKGDARGVQAALDREAALRERFNARLGALEAEQIVAEQRAAALANASAKVRILDAGSGGGVAAVAAARAEGAGVLRSAVTFGGTVLGGLKGGLTSLFKILGPVGIGLTAIDFGLQVKGAADEINRARHDLQDGNNQFENKPLTVANLRDNASNVASGAQNLRQARSGITGFFADLFVNDGAGSGKDIKAADNLTRATNNAANILETQTNQLRGGLAGNAAAASTIDISSPDTIKTSFEALRGAGFTAAQSMDVLIERIKQLRLVVSSTAQLTAEEKAALVQGAGREAVQAIGELPDTQKRVGLGKAGGATIPIPAVNLIDAPSLQGRVDQIVQSQIAGGTDVGSTAGKTALEQALLKGYSDLVPDQAYATQLASKISDFVYKHANQFANQVSSVADLQNVVDQGLTGADAAAQEATRNAQLNSLTGGTRDNSALAGANARLATLQGVRQVARAKLAQLAVAQRGQGGPDEGVRDNTVTADLQALNDKIAEAQIAQLQAITQQAQQALQDSNLVRRNEQGKAKTDAQIKAIGQKFLASDIKTALATNDIDTIRSVFDEASKAEIDAILQTVDNVAAAKAAAAKTAAAAAIAANAALAVISGTGDAPASTRDTAGGAVEDFDKAAVAQATAAANRANRIAASTAKQAKAAHTAAQQANPQNIYDTGSDRNGGGGDTIAQINAAFAQAKAIRDRNSTEVLQAAVQAAQADYDAAKDQKSKAQALQQLYAAENALADNLKAIGVASRFVNIFPASAIQTAIKSIADARLELAKTARGTLEYYQGLAALVQAQRALAEANQAAYFVSQKLGSDLTNPVAQARIAVREAAAKLALLRKEGAPKDLQNQARLDLKNAENSSEAAAFSQRFSDAQTNDQLGRISHAAYIRYLDNEHNRLTAIRHRTRQQQDELNQVDQAIKSAQTELQGQFNLGDIKIPTPYEVRRYIATQAKAATVGATAQAAAGVSAGTSGNSGTVTITVNGADVAFVRRVMSEYLGPSATSTRAVTASRKG